MGSVLVGSEVLIRKARRWRKMLGGGLRQVGVVAAAGLYALEHNVQRLADDHHRAGKLAAHLNRLECIGKATNQTNMVFLDTSAATLGDLRTYLLENDVIISGGRLVFHKDISDSDLDRLLNVITQFSQNR